MSGDRQPPERVGVVGPIELTSDLGPTGLDPAGLDPPDPDDAAIGDAGPGRLERRLSGWWNSLAPGRRRTGSVLLALAVAAAVGVPVLDRHPPPPLPPLPNELTDVQYLGIDSGGGQDTHEFTITILVGDTGPTPLTLRGITQGYPGISLSVAPNLPLTAKLGRPLQLRLQATVYDCLVVPPDDPYPVLVLTVSDSRATQTQSDALGDPYIMAMHGALLRACQGIPGFGGPFPPEASNSGLFPP